MASDGSRRRRKSDSSPSAESDDDDDAGYNQRRRRRFTAPSKSTKKIPGDRISMLPDSLILHILSFLPIEDAIKTQLLSKRWQYLWPSLSSLFFGYNCFDPDEHILRDFVAFVDKTLVLSNCSKLKKFGVDFEYKPRFVSHVDLWARFAAAKGAEELQLEFEDAAESEELKEEDFYVLPQHLFSNSSFRELRFSFCRVTPKGIVKWRLLKKLSLGYVKLSEDVIKKILEGSPVLETLELHDFHGFNRLYISNPSVKKLMLRDYSDPLGEDNEIDVENDDLLEIWAPNLQSLEISGCLWEKNCRLVDMSSLVDANLSCHFVSNANDPNNDYEWHQMKLRGLLESLVHVKNLTLNTWALQVLSIMETKGLRSPLSKRKSLTLETSIKESVLPGIASLLESSSHLETLVIIPSISTEYFWRNHNQLFNFNGEHYWTLQKRTFRCLVLHLKTVKFVGLSWSCWDLSFSFIQYLLKHARVLQKMVINMRREDRIRHMECIQAAQKFLSFPRSSPDAIVIFP